MCKVLGRAWVWMEMLALAYGKSSVFMGLGAAVGNTRMRRRGERLKQQSGISAPADVLHHNVPMALPLKG